MSRRAFFAVLAVLAVTVLAAPAALRADAYQDPTGFSFTPPRGWVVATKDRQDALFAEARRKLPQMAKMDLSRVAVFAFDSNPAGEFASNFNVVVMEDVLAATERNRQELEQRLPGQFSSMGMQIQDLKIAFADIAGRKALTAAGNMRMPGVKTEISQRQVYVPGPGKTYILTLAAARADAAAAEPAFQEILASFQAPPATSPWTTPAMTGAIGGAIVGLIFYLRRKKQAQAELAWTPVPPAAGGWGVPTAGSPAGAPEPADPLSIPLAGEPMPPPLPSAAPPPAAEADYIRFACACGQNLKAPAGASGKTSRCPKCQATVQIP